MKLIIIAFSLITTAMNCFAAVITVTADRNLVYLDESFQLNFIANGTTDDEPDFSLLEKDFEILNKTQSSNIAIINGDYSKTQSWTVTVMPNRAGTLYVPRISFGNDQSNPITIKVKQISDSSPAAATNTDIFIEVEVEPENPYVQAQVLYTVRFLRRVEITQASLSEPELDAAIIEKLGEDNSYYAQRNGQRYAVTERSYAIFPQKSGPITISPLELSAKIVTSQRRNSMFNGFFNRQATKTKRVRSKALFLQVRPVPTSFTGRHWLPAEGLQLTENWSGNPTQTMAGDPITRTVSLVANGVTAGQLPEINVDGQIQGFGSSRGIKQYPDQPVLNERKESRGIISFREEKIALIPSHAGNYTLPDIEIPWWNTQTDKMEIARISSSLITALPTESQNLENPKINSQTTDNTASPKHAIEPIMQLSEDKENMWVGISIFLALGWTITVIIWWTRNVKSKTKSIGEPTASRKESAAINALKKACHSNDPNKAKDALLDWAKLSEPTASLTNLNDIAMHCGSALRNEIQRLAKILYSESSENWQGLYLWAAYKSFKNKKPSKSEKAYDNELEPLFKV